MFSLSTRSDYGLLLLTLLAKREDNSIVSLADLVRETQLPRPFLSQIAAKLARSGILLSREGVRGGYKLAKRAEEISVAEVILILDGSLSPTKCTQIKKECRYENICPMQNKWQGVIREKIWQVLTSYTVKDLA